MPAAGVDALNAEIERLAELLDRFAALSPNAGPYNLVNDPWANRAGAEL